MSSRNIPLHDLFASYTYQNKMHQLQTLSKFVILNKKFHDTFKDPLERLKTQIMAVVSLCHFFDLTRHFPQNTFQGRIGITFLILSPDKQVDKSYHVYVDKKRFILRIVDFHSPDTREQSFVYTKQGYLQLLHIVIPVLKKSPFAMERKYRRYLRPITPFDQEMLVKYNIVSIKTIKKIAQQQRILFKIDPETIHKWQMMSYL